jgi:hypothetical protein
MATRQTRQEKFQKIFIPFTIFIPHLQYDRPQIGIDATNFCSFYAK